jgi:tRNA dimethylallyltransferase
VPSALPSLNSKPTPFIIAGPTGVGKTAFAADFAQRVGGEIVCADAFQVYRGMAVLTAQPDVRTMARARHHLYGVIDPARSFNAAHYAAMLAPTLEDIQSRGCVPVLVGGSGLYLRAATGGLDPLPEPDVSLRARLSAMTCEQALRELEALDPEAAGSIDSQNPRRVKRALEIVIQTGRPLAESRAASSRAAGAWRGICLVRDRAELHARIARNVATMFESGVVDEVAALGAVGPTAGMAIGLSEVRDVLAGRLTREAAIESISITTRRYAKRQLTWFRNQTNFPQVTLSPNRPNSEALDSLKMKSRCI